jgi:S1-C subfamily serine protease
VRLCATIATLLFASVRQSDAQPAFKLTPQQAYEWTGIIRIASTGAPIGSGFVFGHQNDVVTCWHVKHAQDSIPGHLDLSFLHGTNHYRLKLKYMLPKYDLAVFSCEPEFKISPLKTGDFKKLRPGDWVVYFGFDQRQSDQYKQMTSYGIAQIAAIGSALNDGVVVDFLEFAGAGIPGFSGGLVINADGEVVAIMREAWMKKDMKGGAEIPINRAFSMEILSVLDGQLLKDAPPGSASTNATQIGITDILSFTNK